MGRRTPKKWTEEEDKILYDEAKKQSLTGSVKDWHGIAAKLPGRTNKDCRKRWVNKVCGSLKKGAWDEVEDARLIAAVGMHGQRWTLVANSVGFRSPDQCAKRWQYNLDPNLQHGGWTITEDEQLLRFVQNQGRQWKLMQQQLFPSRSRNELKNRYTILFRKMRHCSDNTSTVVDLSISGSPRSEGSGFEDDAEITPHTGEVAGTLYHDYVTSRPEPALLHQLQESTESWMSTIGNGHWLGTLSLNQLPKPYSAAEAAETIPVDMGYSSPYNHHHHHHTHHPSHTNRREQQGCMPHIATSGPVGPASHPVQSSVGWPDFAERYQIGASPSNIDVAHYDDSRLSYQAVPTSGPGIGGDKRYQMVTTGDALGGTARMETSDQLGYHTLGMARSLGTG